MHKHEYSHAVSTSPDTLTKAKTPPTKTSIYWTRRRIIVRIVIPWLFILPILTLHATVVFVPAVQGVLYSFTDWSGIGAAKYVGLDNFKTLFTTDTSFQEALLRNIKWMLFFVSVPFVLALFASSILAAVRRGSMIYRTLLFLPYILPSIVTATIWRYLYNPRFGIGAQLAQLGVRGLDVPLLGQSDTALWAIAFADNWHFWGFLMVLFLTAMQSIPPDLYDAAEVDGANRFDQFWHVTLPGIRPTVLFMLMMVMIWSFLVFEYVYILTQGGPAGASEVLGVIIYKNAFLRFEAGYAAAQGLTISMFAVVIVGTFLFLRRRGWEI
jgi:raffinose/stachyose/melibiose transport system permease protein